MVASGAINPVYYPAEDMAADILTEALPKWKVSIHIATLGMRRACGGVMENAPLSVTVSILK
jgi:hypothetical protein